MQQGTIWEDTVDPATILIIHDHPHVPDVFSVILRAEGYQVTGIRPTPALLTTVRRVRPELVLVDCGRDRARHAAPCWNNSRPCSPAPRYCAWPRSKKRWPCAPG